MTSQYGIASALELALNWVSDSIKFVYSHSDSFRVFPTPSALRCQPSSCMVVLPILCVVSFAFSGRRLLHYAVDL